MNRFLTPWVSCLVLLCMPGTQAQTVHIAHCLHSCPEAGAANDLVLRHLYAASIDPATGLAEWVAYRVLDGSVGIASLLPRYWLRDELLPADIDGPQVSSGPRFFQPDLSDQPDRSYRINEIAFAIEDRGRLAPLTSYAGTPYWDELNRLSNMTPIPTPLRQGSWARLEQAINELAGRAGELYIVSGPIFQPSSAGSDRVAPIAFFKLVATDAAHVAFRFPADLPIHASYCAQLSSLAQVEAEIGRRLLPGREPPPADLATALAC